MARTPLVAGNWKMHKTVDEALDLVANLDSLVEPLRNVEVVVCPAAIAIVPVAERLAHSPIGIGAQHMHWEAEGAFTGEVSAPMLQGLCEYVIVGHSERRQHFGETDVKVNLRVKAAAKHGLRPIVCVGETLEENEANHTAEVVSRQVRAGLEGLPDVDARQLVMAYEPVWAIGTGKAATAEGANDVIEVIIRPALEYLFGEEIAQAARVLYGGSVTPDNASEFFSQPGVDGALVGGASLRAADFAAIARAATMA